MSAFFLGNSVTVFSRRQKRPTSKAWLHSYLGIAVSQKKAKSKQIPLQAACRGETGLGKGRERKGDPDTGVTNAPFESHRITATEILQNARLLCCFVPLNHTDPRRGQPSLPLSKVRYSPAEIWWLCAHPQQSRTTAWSKKVMQKTHLHGHLKLSRNLSGRNPPLLPFP